MSNPITIAGLVWEEPPASQRGGPNSDWWPIAETLRANAGRWARIAEDAPASIAANIRAGRLLAFAEGFEAKARMLPGSKNRAAIYVRYVGAEVVA